MRLELGNRVRCTDGAYGELADIVIDPLEKRVTHLVVTPAQREGEARLVPIQLAKGRDDEQREIELECTLGEAQGFESVHEAAYLRLGESLAADPDWDVGVEDVLAMPYYPGLGYTGLEGPYPGDPDGHVTTVLRPRAEGRGRGPVDQPSHLCRRPFTGRGDGFVVDADEHITHFVLERGHLWGRKEVTIPIGAVARLESDAVHVALSKDEIGALPAVRVGRHG